MDYNPRRQWRNQRYQSEHLASAKIPRLFHECPSATAALRLFVPKMSAFPDSTTTPTPRFAKMGSGLFSLGQWQELELQALIFKYMLAGAAVPAELVHSIKKSLVINSPRQQLLHPAMMQSGYWGRAFEDPEPGRCRRTDGKKWRCSRDVVGGHKYCERHVHRGRNRSRKHVEAQPTQPNVGLESQSPNTLVAAALPLTHNLHLNQRSLKSEPGGNEDRLDNNHHDNALSDGKHQGPQVFQHFFDGWPKSQQQPNASPRLSMSISQVEAGQSYNFFLRLSTSSEEDNYEADQAHRMNWDHSMGGPLAEALQSWTSGSPISVLHEPPCGSRSQTSSAST